MPACLQHLLAYGSTCLMVAQGEDPHPSGPGQSTMLAQQAAAGIASGETVTMAVKTATMKQLSCILTFGCAKGGFPTFNCHLFMDELTGLGWQDLQHASSASLPFAGSAISCCRSCQPRPESWSSFRWRLTVGKPPLAHANALIHDSCFSVAVLTAGDRSPVAIPAAAC